MTSNSSTSSENSKEETISKELYVFLNDTKERLSVSQVQQLEVTYSNYIETEKLLSLQNSNIKQELHHHDEHLFIVVHQSFELWFKQILFEMDTIRGVLQTFLEKKQHIPMQAINVLTHRLGRCDQILRHSCGAFDMLETMHPADFLEFRDYIGPASGFQSVQLREIEVSLGLHDSQRHLHSGKPFTFFLKHDKKALEKLEKRFKEPTMKNLLNKWMELFFERVPDKFESVFMEKKLENLLFQKSLWNKDADKAKEEALKEMTQTEQFLSPKHDIESPNPELPDDNPESVRKRRIAILYIMCYRNHLELSVLSNFIDSIVAFEEAMLLWRTRHVRMVERMIGNRPGTGGSSGVGYLEKTLSYRVFSDLWECRSHFVRFTALPPLSMKP